MSVETCSVDFETRSTADLRKTGVYRYAEDKTTDIWCMCFAFDDGDVVEWTPRDTPHPRLVEHVLAQKPLRAFNAQFERVIWNEIMVKRYGWPKTSVKQWVCTAAEARAMALPGALGTLADVLGVDQQKDKQGASLMMRMARPRAFDEAGEPIWWDVPDRVARLIQYCAQDVRTEVAIARAIRRLGDNERKTFELDQKINDRGVQLDVKLARAAKAVAEKATLEANRAMYDLTHGKVAKVTNVGRLTAWLREQGVEVDSLGKNSIKALQEGAEGTIADVLTLRTEAGKSSVAKIESMLNCVCADGRVRGLLLYHGAATGRWAGRLVQPQNMPKPTIEEIETYIPLVYARDVEAIDALAPPLDVISSMLRSMLVAGPGNKLVAADFAAIEARVLAWLAGEAWRLDVFKSHGKIYEASASTMFSIPLEEFIAHKEETGEHHPVRAKGKVAELALGFQGGHRALEKMGGAEMGLSVDEMKDIVQRWRAKNPNIVRFWAALNEAALNAVREPGSVHPVAGGKIKYTMRGGYLWCILPSKRPLAYARPKIVERETPWGSTNEVVSFEGINSLTKKWERHDFYGGLGCENVVQAVARDLMAEAMLRCEAAGYLIVTSVHDELVAEVPADFGTVAEFEALMSETPDWAVGCPVTAEGWEGPRYRK